jgi:hypothetical protein
VLRENMCSCSASVLLRDTGQIVRSNARATTGECAIVTVDQEAAQDSEASEELCREYGNMLLLFVILTRSPLYVQVNTRRKPENLTRLHFQYSCRLRCTGLKADGPPLRSLQILRWRQSAADLLTMPSCFARRLLDEPPLPLHHCMCCLSKCPRVSIFVCQSFSRSEVSSDKVPTLAMKSLLKLRSVSCVYFFFTS